MICSISFPCLGDPGTVVDSGGVRPSESDESGCVAYLRVAHDYLEGCFPFAVNGCWDRYSVG